MLKPSIEDIKDLTQRTTLTRSQTLSAWLLAITIVCTVLDFSMIAWDRFLSPRFASSSDELELLSFQNPYLNLEVLYMNPDFKSSTYDPIINNAPVLAQVSKTEPQKIFPPFQRYTSVDHESIPIYERRLIVTHEVCRS